MASAQVKSCLLLAGLATTARRRSSSRFRPATTPSGCCFSAGAATKLEAHPPHRGRCDLTTVRGADELELDAIEGPRLIRRRAAFLIAAGMHRAAVRGSVLEGVGVNWTRTWFHAHVGSEWAPFVLGELEPLGQLRGHRADLGARRQTPARSRRPRSRPTRCRWPSMSCRSSRCSAALPKGETIVRGAGELRVKESDRIATVVDGLRGLGAEIEALRRRLCRYVDRRAGGGTMRRPRRPSPRDARRGRRPRPPRGESR